MNQFNAVDPRSRWPLGIAVVVIVALLVVIVVLVSGKEDAPAGAGRAGESLTPTASVEGPVQAASGCLGGSEELSEVVLRASAEAPDTAEGAAGYLASYLRWITAVRVDPTLFRTVGPKVWASTMSAQAIEETRVKWLDDPRVTEPLRISLVDHKYRIESFSGNKATISFLATLLGENDRAVAGFTYRAVYEDGGWHFAGDDTGKDLTIAPTAWMAELNATGTAFREAC